MPSTKVLPSQNVSPEADGAAGEHGCSDVVADGVAAETRQRCDAVWHVFLADGSQREVVIKCQRAECADHAQGGERDVAWRYLRQRSQDHAGIDAPEGTDQRRDREGDNEEARRDSQPFPADPFLEATPQRGQQSVHSSSRQGAISCKPNSKAIDGKRRPIALLAKT
jgi:hypothetical protein